MSRPRSLEGRPRPADLDETDRRLLDALSADGRARARALGRELGLSESTVAARLRRLTVTGVVTGVHASIDAAALGRPLQVQIRLRLRPGASIAALEEAAARLPAVYAGAVLAGDHDLELRLACCDAADLNQCIAELRRCGAGECQVEVVLRAFSHPVPASCPVPASHPASASHPVPASRPVPAGS